MKLVDMKVKEFLDILKSDIPAPGGGSVSALSGAEGVALIMMVADLTTGKEKYADFQNVCNNVKEEGHEIYENLIKSVDRDTEAYNLVSEAFKMPKNTEEEKTLRRKAISDGTLVATEVPFRTMQLGFEGLKLAKSLVGKSNPNCASDLGVAILQLRSCIFGAWMNVLINLPGIKDKDKLEYYSEKGKEVYLKSIDMSDKIYEEVIATL